MRVAAGTCKDCGARALVCPVGLDPRRPTKPKDDIGGLAIDGFPARNHRLTCGERVRACENQLRGEGLAAVPLRLSPRTTSRSGSRDARARRAQALRGARNAQRPQRP